MYCTKCGKQLPDDATYCDACGMRFEPEQPELQYDPPTAKAEPHMISLAVAGYPGGSIFAQFFAELLQGLSYGVIIWLLSDAVLYLQTLVKMKKQELKNK